MMPGRKCGANAKAQDLIGFVIVLVGLLLVISGLCILVSGMFRQ